MTDVSQCDQTCFHPDVIDRVRAGLAEHDHPASDVAAGFAALANPQRLTILRALRISELCVCDLASVLRLSTAATSQQLRLLREQGWLDSRRDGKQVYYRLRDGRECVQLVAELTTLSTRTAAAALA